ncbi:MAG: GntR family transcriptional regulator, partial [Terriglobales bacterium]
MDGDAASSAVGHLYQQVRRYVEDLIVSGRLDAKGRLPSTRQLAEELAVSRNTVALAYQELVAEGFVTSRDRSGLYINSEVAALLAERDRSPERRESRSWLDRRILPQADAKPHLNKPIDWHEKPYPFVCGQVDPTLFPIRSWMRCLAEAVTGPNLVASLSDTPGRSDPLLLEQLCRRLLPTRGIHASPDEVLITMGTQEGLSLICAALI